jgi:hypothetical protein
LRWIAGADGVSSPDISSFATPLGFTAVQQSQAGLITDMNFIADVIYNRAAARAGTAG